MAMQVNLRIFNAWITAKPIHRNRIFDKNGFGIAITNAVK
jgi:hypothetical protein